MATFASLTPAQQAQLKAFMPLMRSATIQYVKALNRLAALDQLWTNSISSVNALLDASEVIPDTNGLDGASQLSHDDLVVFIADVEAVLGAKNDAAHRAFYARACGLSNTTQQS